MRHQVVFFCPKCKRRIAFFRDTPFCWHLFDRCPDIDGVGVRMRRSKNQDIGEAERSHVG